MVARTFLVVLAVVAGLVAGCGSGGSDQEEAGAGAPGQAGPGARPVITPPGELVSEENSGDLPEATARVGLDCQREVGKRGSGVAARMDRVANSSSSTDSQKAVALVCGAAAAANEGRDKEALARIDKAEQYIPDAPPSMKRSLMAFSASVEAKSAAAEGEYQRAEAALKELDRLGYERNDFLKIACSVAADPAGLPACATVAPSGGETETPPDEPETSETSEPETPTGEVSETDEGATQSPDEGTTEAPETEAPVSPDGNGDDGPAPAES
ncbi:hypothetical protein AB0K12_38755 [Nonomuraea sp. NPDC049419]|uniref:hypothetical protein n=1 Tax=Nonomuraea sp. NPDC049419 TaxID=3155772 RepID=UPI0034302C11